MQRVEETVYLPIMHLEQFPAKNQRWLQTWQKLQQPKNGTISLKNWSVY